MIDGQQWAAHDRPYQCLVGWTLFVYSLANQIRFADETTVVTGLVYQQCADFCITHLQGCFQERGVRTDRTQGSAHHDGERSLKRSALNRHTTRSVKNGGTK